MLTLSNVFFLTAFAFLSGMFADDSNRRLAAFFSKWSKDSSPDRVGRKPGAESRPAALVRIDRLEPENLGVGSEGAVVAVVGQGFDPGSRVVLSGAPRDTTFVDETMLKFSMVGNELEDAVKMELKVRTSKGLVSNVVILEVMEA